jgi:outer membrane protein assembly factor BamB
MNRTCVLFAALLAGCSPPEADDSIEETPAGLSATAWTDSIAGSAVGPPAYGNGWIAVSETNFGVSRVLLLDAATGRQLASLGMPDAAPIAGAPSIVQLADGNWYVLVTTLKAHLYKLLVPASDPTAFQLAGGVSLSRPPTSCVDSLPGSPAVQLKSRSTGWAGTDDLAIVPTHHNCGDVTNNVIFGVRLSTLAVAWIANNWGELGEMDAASSGCTIDYALNRVYCGTNLAPGRAQATVWALDTATGRLAWAKQAGSVVSQLALEPKPANQTWRHLYAVALDNHLHALDPDNAGHEDWSAPLSANAAVQVTTNLGLGSGSFANLIFATDTAGVVHAVTDYRTVGAALWDCSFAASNLFAPNQIPRATTAPAVEPAARKVYVGLNDGWVAEVDVPSGQTDAVRKPAGTGVVGSYAVSDPSWHAPGWLVAATAGAGMVTLAEYATPF